MSRNNTKAIKSINRMYEQMNLNSEDILHKTKLLLSVYRDVVWATLHEVSEVQEDIYYFGNELTDALVYLEEFAPDTEKAVFERTMGYYYVRTRKEKLNVGSRVKTHKFNLIPGMEKTAHIRIFDAEEQIIENMIDLNQLLYIEVRDTENKVYVCKDCFLVG